MAKKEEKKSEQIKEEQKKDKKNSEQNVPEKEVENKETEQKEQKNEEDLSEKIKELEEQVAQLKEQNLLRQADTENFKKRLVREKEEAVLFANGKLISDLLEFLDNLERTIQAAKTGGDAASICNGVEIIQSQLLSSLNKNWGLEKIECTGKEFDPQEHEACMMEVNPELKTETVLAEFQTGYKLHGRVIRPAKVKVGKPE